MATLTELISRLDSVNIADMTAEAVIDSKEEYLDLNLAQLAQGAMSNKQPTLLDGLGYQPSTIKQKQLYGASMDRYGLGLSSVTDRVTLYDTGESYHSADVEIEGNSLEATIQVKFQTPYFVDVLQRTGPDIIGLDEDNRGQYIEGPFFSQFKQLFQEQTKLDLT